MGTAGLIWDYYFLKFGHEQELEMFTFLEYELGPSLIIRGDYFKSGAMSLTSIAIQGLANQYPVNILSVVKRASSMCGIISPLIGIYSSLSNFKCSTYPQSILPLFSLLLDLTPK